MGRSQTVTRHPAVALEVLSADDLGAVIDMEAAERVLEGQMKQGLKKVSQLKSGPEAENAGKMELAGADYLVEPLDIRGSDNDSAQPLSADF